MQDTNHHVGNPCIARLKSIIAIVSLLVSSWHVRKTGTVVDNFQLSPQWHLRNVHHVPIGLFLENLTEGVTSSASAQHQLEAVAALGRPLVDTTGAARRVLFVGSVQCV